MMGANFPTDLSDILGYSVKMCYTWLEAEPSQLIYLVPVGPCRLRGPAHILLLKQTNEAPERASEGHGSCVSHEGCLL